MTSLFDLTGRCAVVTGSSRGIGRAIAEAMADHGANVVISSRRQDACEAVAEAIGERHGPGRAVAVAANISDRGALENLVAKAKATFGPVDALVCNAASNPYYGPMAQIGDEAFAKILHNNVVANNQLISMVAPDMIERGGGSVTIVSSIGGLRGSPVIGAYCVSKAADFQLARNYAVEYGRHGVRVNCIAPGLIRTDFARALWENPDNLTRALATTPMGRIGEPDEIAGAAVFLASDAARYMTGQTIVIDGGATAS